LGIFNKYKQVPIAFILMLVMYFFFLSSIIFNQFMVYNFKDEADYLSKTLLVLLFSYGITFPLVGNWLKNGASKRVVLSLGFIFYSISLIYFFSIIQTSLSLNDLLFPYFLQGIGNTFTLTTLSTFMATNIDRNDNKDRVMCTITARYLLGVIICSCFYSNWLYRSRLRRKYI